jgi:hypothetical protein
VTQSGEINRIDADLYQNADIKTNTESETVRQASPPDYASIIALSDGSAIASDPDLTSNLYSIL